jgi:hypothetical protein
MVRTYRPSTATCHRLRDAAFRFAEETRRRIAPGLKGLGSGWLDGLLKTGLRARHRALRTAVGNVLLAPREKGLDLPLAEVVLDSDVVVEPMTA